MSARFAVGDSVTWRISNAHPSSKTYRFQHGIGPFSVVKVEEVPDGDRNMVGHSQWVTIRLSNGEERRFTGAYLKHI